MRRVLLVTCADLAPSSAVAPGPRRDYMLLAGRLGADILDSSRVQRSRSARLLRKVAGRAMAQAWLAFRSRGRYDALISDGEHIGIPLAGMLKLAGTSVPHITIGHRISA